jgi:hypothetical protein
MRRLPYAGWARFVRGARPIALSIFSSEEARWAEIRAYKQSAPCSGMPTYSADVPRSLHAIGSPDAVTPMASSVFVLVGVMNDGTSD